MIVIEEDSKDRFLRRSEAARYVVETYNLPCSPKTLAKLACNVLASVGRIGAVERGFFDRIATRATYGRVPTPLNDIEIEIATASGRHKAGDLRRGEDEAAKILRVARLNNCPDTIFNYLVGIHSGRDPLPVGVEAQVYVIAGAALSGSAN